MRGVATCCPVPPADSPPELPTRPPTPRSRPASRWVTSTTPVRASRRAPSFLTAPTSCSSSRHPRKPPLPATIFARGGERGFSLRRISWVVITTTEKRTLSLHGSTLTLNLFFIQVRNTSCVIVAEYSLPQMRYTSVEPAWERAARHCAGHANPSALSIHPTRQNGDGIATYVGSVPSTNEDLSWLHRAKTNPRFFILILL